jgi:hypothetical protein
MRILGRLLVLLLEVAVGVLLAAAVIGLSFGVMRAVGHPLDEQALGAVTVAALAGCVGAMVLRRGGALRGSRGASGPRR